jgi:hypothetical protein
MFKKIFVLFQSMALLLPIAAQAENEIAGKWLEENRNSIEKEDVLVFVICEAGK